MTKDDIKKALEICNDINLNCNDCPYDAVGNCNDTLCADALKLIIEQEKEIERLKANCYRSIMDAFENNRDKIVENIQTEIDDYKQSIKQAKIDVLNKLKDSYGLYYLSAFGVKERMLADILNQMIEELKK